jgi:hypothetical protein
MERRRACLEVQARVGKPPAYGAPKECWGESCTRPRLLRKLEAAKSKRRGALGGSKKSLETQRKIRAAMAWAEAAGRLITKLTVEILWDIIQDNLKL